MWTLLRRLFEWRGRRKGAQIIIFDGGSEVEKTKSFVTGVAVGGGLVAVVFALTAPTGMDSTLMEEIRRREALVQASTDRAEQAIQVADVCLNTARNLERTLAAYQGFLGNRQTGGTDGPPSLLPWVP